MLENSINVTDVSKKFRLYHEKRTTLYESITGSINRKPHYESLQVLNNVSFNVKFRDIEFIWGIILHAGFFLTPIFYRFDMLPEYVQNILQLSPVVQIVEMVHHVTLYGTLPTLNSVLYSVGSIFAILGIGYLIFRKYQARIVEEM